jgi:hypothetical protein
MDEECCQIEVYVTALIPEFQQVKVKDYEGRQYALTERTAGVDLQGLRQGQRLVCTVTRILPRVLQAEEAAESHDRVAGQ